MRAGVARRDGAGRNAVAITGAGTINAAFAGGAEALGGWLAAPRSCARPEDGFRTPVARLAPDALGGLVDEHEARRLSRVCQLAVVAARLALQDAALPRGAELALIVGTEFGDLRSTMEFADGYLSGGPTGLSALLFPNTVMNAMAAATSIAVAARGLSLTLVEPTVAGELAVAQAAAAVAAGRAAAALAGGVDQVDPFLSRALDDLGAPAITRGEGATFLVLEPLEAARARGARVLGRIAGAAWRALPARAHGVGRGAGPGAIAPALAAAGVEAASLGWLYGSANGDAARDAWEDRMLAATLRHRPPRAALRPLLGDHAGAGALGVAAAAWTARAGRAPGAANATRGGIGPGLVHGVARGGAHVALVVAPAEEAA